MSMREGGRECVYMHTCIHAYIHTYRWIPDAGVDGDDDIHTYTHTCIHRWEAFKKMRGMMTYIHTYIHTFIHVSMREGGRVCIQAYMHTYVHTYMHTDG